MTDQTRQAIIEGVILRHLKVEAPALVHEIGQALQEASEIEQEIRVLSGDHLAELDRYKAATKIIDGQLDRVRQRCRHPATTRHGAGIYLRPYRTCDVCGAELPI